MKNILKKGTICTLKIEHKKSRNYGNAANQFLFHLGNDAANIVYNIEITHNSVNNNTNGGNNNIPNSFNYICVGTVNNALTLKSSDGIKDAAINRGFNEDISLVLNSDSSPYNVILSPKDNNEIKDTANNKGIRKDIGLFNHPDSSPYNDINSPKRIKTWIHPVSKKTI